MCFVVSKPMIDACLQLRASQEDGLQSGVYPTQRSNARKSTIENRQFLYRTLSRVARHLRFLRTLFVAYFSLAGVTSRRKVCMRCVGGNQTLLCCCILSVALLLFYYAGRSGTSDMLTVLFLLPIQKEISLAFFSLQSFTSDRIV